MIGNLFSDDPVDVSGAVFSPCRQYRYTLRRSAGGGHGTILWIMLNPSTADETINDPTIRRCIGFSKKWNYGTVVICNLFAWRSTDPDVLPSVDDPVGEFNDAAIASEARTADRIVCAWGKPGQMRGRGHQVAGLLRADGKELFCLGLNQDGTPKHPLYLAEITPLQSY